METSEEVISIIRVIIECHHRSWLEVVLICKGPWLTSWKIVFRYWRTLTVGPTAVPPPWEKINVYPMSIYTWPRNFSRQPLNFNQKFMKVLICAWLYLSCSIPFNHLSLICLGCCAEPSRPDTNCGGLVWWEWWEWWECDAHLTILSFRDKNTFLREVGQTLRKHHCFDGRQFKMRWSEPNNGNNFYHLLLSNLVQPCILQKLWGRFVVSSNL